MEKVIVKGSDIQGKGVYANINISKDDVVLEIDDSHVVTDPSKLTKEQNKYDCDYLQNGKVILMQEPEKYINHSCNPNVYVKTIDGVRKIIAMRDIKCGEEIVYDYSMNGDNDGTFQCRCGSNKCRGVYQGSYFKLPIDLQIKYLPYLDGWFVNEHEAEIELLKQK
jgi:SET domain-containing protein